MELRDRDSAQLLADAGPLSQADKGGSCLNLQASSSSDSLGVGERAGSADGVLEHGLPKRALEGKHEGEPSITGRRRSHSFSAKRAKQRRVPEGGVNLRDVGGVAPRVMKQGAVFRSSELMSPEDMKKYGIKTILDLRRMDRPCKDKEGLCQKLFKGFEYVLKGPRMVVPEKAQLYATRGKPKPCALCQRGLEERLDVSFDQVVHADLIPGLVGFRIFQAMPTSVRLKAIGAALTGKGASSVMAPAVANPLYMGYKVLYKTMLEDAKRGVAKAIRVFANPKAFPVLIHCIHGKDRTGIIVMLLLMLCGVSADLILEDYIRSEEVLKESRLHERLDLDFHLTTDDVIAATHATMEETIAYINDTYGSAANYLKEAGLEEWELARVRVNLMSHADMRDVLSRPRERGSVPQPLNTRGSIFRRASLSGGTRARSPRASTDGPRASTDGGAHVQPADVDGGGGATFPSPIRRRSLFLRANKSAPLDDVGVVSLVSSVPSSSPASEAFMSGWTGHQELPGGVGPVPRPVTRASSANS